MGLAQGLVLKGQMGKCGETPPKVYVLLGDGELQEGQNWEAAMYAAHYGLDNVIAIVDRNMLQIDGNTEDVMQLGDVGAKFEAFGWEVATVDGHDIPAIYEVLSRTRSSGKPYAIIADTVKGKGVSFMEDVADWHGVAPNVDECATACAELEAVLEAQLEAAATLAGVLTGG